MNVIWECPSCGNRHKAPSMLRRTAVARFCLDCSASSVLLVERIRPRAERLKRERVARREANLAKAHADRSLPLVLHGVDLVAEYRRLAQLVPGIPLAIKIEVHRALKFGARGRFNPVKRLLILSATGCRNTIETKVVLTHEAAHALHLSTPAGRLEPHHADGFLNAYAKIGRLAYGLGLLNLRAFTWRQYGYQLGRHLAEQAASKPAAFVLNGN